MSKLTLLLNIARASKSPTNTEWKQSVTMGCLLYYTQNHSMMQYIYACPTGITTQNGFRGLYLTTNVYFDGTYYIIGGYQVTNVAIAGVGTFAANGWGYNALVSYKGQNYNVFFNYV